MTGNVAISIRDLSHSYNTKEGEVVALDSVSMTIQGGEWMAVLGPSGSGKSTLLRCIAGLERPRSGEIRIGDRVVYSERDGIFVPPEKRELSMVFQSYALWPHMSAFDNVAYPLASNTKSRLTKSSISERVNAALDRVGCLHLASRHPAQMSGGQQQRVAVARAIVSDVKAVLFDEPLSSVDLRVREKLRTDLRILQSELGLGAVYVTHDQSEAFVLGQRVTVMHDGRIAQISAPAEIYGSPANAFVAEFVGSSNVLAGCARPAGPTEDPSFDTALGVIIASYGDGDPTASVGSEVDLAIRPEDASLSATLPSQPEANCWEAAIVTHSFMGMYTEYVVRVGETMIVVREQGQHSLGGAKSAWLSVASSSVKILLRASATADARSEFEKGKVS